MVRSSDARQDPRLPLLQPRRVDAHRPRCAFHRHPAATRISLRGAGGGNFSSGYAAYIAALRSATSKGSPHDSRSLGVPKNPAAINARVTQRSTRWCSRNQIRDARVTANLHPVLLGPELGLPVRTVSRILHDEVLDEAQPGWGRSSSTVWRQPAGRRRGRHRRTDQLTPTGTSASRNSRSQYRKNPSWSGPIWWKYRWSYPASTYCCTLCRS